MQHLLLFKGTLTRKKMFQINILEEALGLHYESLLYFKKFLIFRLKASLSKMSLLSM
jgi:hypothetical protein